MIDAHKLFGDWARDTMSDAEVRAWQVFEKLTGEKPPTFEEAERAEQKAWAEYERLAEKLGRQWDKVPPNPSDWSKAKAAYDRWAQAAALVAVALRWRGEIVAGETAE